MILKIGRKIGKKHPRRGIGGDEIGKERNEYVLLITNQGQIVCAHSREDKHHLV